MGAGYGYVELVVTLAGVKGAEYPSEDRGEVMAPGRLSSPGTNYGPCTNVDCGHIDCADTRSMAEVICHYCNEPIGYERGFYYEHHTLVHSSCAEDSVEEDAENASAN